MRSSGLLALAGALSAVSAMQGFNYGATNADGSFKYQADYTNEFTTAQNLVGTSGFSSARLYTMIQGGSSTNEPTQAIPAAIKTKTSLLLGLWASGGDGPFQAEITALQSAIKQYGDDFTSLVVGISVGSEDLYRDSAQGKSANAGVGVDAATIAGYISTLRSAVKGTGLEKAPVGHVDTWTAWVDGSNSAVVDACDWVGMDAYPYFQNTMTNDIGNGKSLFEKALSDTQGAVGSKDVWITETGWPVSGKTENLGVPSLANAKTFWDEVGCPRFGKVNMWWYTLQDAQGSTPNPSFGIVGSTLSTTPLFDLSCSNITSSTSSSASSSATKTASSSASSVASSLSTAVSGTGVASSGSGLSPTGMGAGISGANATTSASGTTETGASGSIATASSGGNSSIPGTSAKPSTTVVTGGTSIMSGSFAAGVFALFIAVLTL
jgi:glucan endo-1,3-beta-D-glucosidase